jgi:hypothetical protein
MQPDPVLAEFDPSQSESSDQNHTIRRGMDLSPVDLPGPGALTCNALVRRVGVGIGPRRHSGPMACWRS